MYTRACQYRTMVCYHPLIAALLSISRWRPAFTALTTTVAGHCRLRPGTGHQERDRYTLSRTVTSTNLRMGGACVCRYNACNTMLVRAKRIYRQEACLIHSLVRVRSLLSRTGRNNNVAHALVVTHKQIVSHVLLLQCSWIFLERYTGRGPTPYLPISLWDPFDKGNDGTWNRTRGMFIHLAVEQADDTLGDVINTSWLTYEDRPPDR